MLSIVYLSPEWFYEYSIVFELFFFLVAMLISWFAFKAHWLVGSKKAEYFGLGFILIAGAYLTQMAANIFLWLQVENSPVLISMVSLTAVNILGGYISMILMIFGLGFLLFVSINAETKRVLAALLTASLIAIFSSSNPLPVFYLLSSLFLALIVWSFTANYLLNKNLSNLAVAAAFLLFFVGRLAFFLFSDDKAFYIALHLVELAAYLLLLISFYLVLKNAREAR